MSCKRLHDWRRHYGAGWRETVSRMLSLGLASDRLTMYVFATVECLISLSLITNTGLLAATLVIADATVHRTHGASGR